MKKLVYILPTNLDHPGITHKVNGQLDALNASFSARLVYFPYHSSDFFIIKYSQLLTFYIRVIITSLFSNSLYVRYNAKLVLLNFFFAILAYFKPVFLEYGSKFDHELKILNRPIERFFHRLSLRLFGISRIIHATVTDDIQTELTSFGIQSKYCITLQNGFKMPEINHIMINVIICHKKKNSFCSSVFKT